MKSINDIFSSPEYWNGHFFGGVRRDFGEGAHLEGTLSPKSRSSEGGESVGVHDTPSNPLPPKVEDSTVGGEPTTTKHLSANCGVLDTGYLFLFK